MPLLTLGDLDARVLARVDNNTELYPTSVRYAAINEAIRIVNLLTGTQQTSVPLTSIADRLFYDVPSGILIPLRVSFERTFLEPTTVDCIGRSNRNWTQATTLNTASPVSLWVKFGLRKFAIWPADGAGGGQILVTGVAEPTLLTQPTDTINWNNGIISVFENYVLTVLQLKESRETFQEAMLGLPAFQQMMQKLTIWRGMQQPMYRTQSRQPTHQ